MLIALYLLVPYLINDTWASVLSLAGVVAIGAIGLNLLTGYTGQPSLGMAAFIGLGAFVAGYYGGGRIADGIGYDFNLFVYMLIAVLAGGAVGVLIGLPALRLRGNYLVIVTLGLVFVALYVWKKWTTFTGGNEGSPMPVKADISLGFWSIDFLKPTVFGKELGSKQGLMYLAWGFVFVTALLVKNIVRTRPGRALQAVRDRDVAAEVVGVSLFRYKVSAFAISSAIASLAGVLYGLYLGYLTPDETSLGLVLSIQFLAVIVVGGHRDDLRIDPRRRLRRGPAHAHPRVRAGQLEPADPRLAHRHQRRGRDGLQQRGVGHRHLRLADHRVPGLRAERPGRDLAKDSGILQDVAVLVLTATKGVTGCGGRSSGDSWGCFAPWRWPSVRRARPRSPGAPTRGRRRRTFLASTARPSSSGSSRPQSGIASVVGKPLTEGNRVYWEAKNAKGGVAGKYKVDLSIEDSQYQVETALQSYDKIKGDVVAFQQILGTQIVKSVNTRLKADNAYGGPASLEGVWVKQPTLMPTGTPYQVLAANGLDWYLKNGGQGKKVCAMAQDDAYGASGLDGLTQASKTLKVKVAKTVRLRDGLRRQRPGR